MSARPNRWARMTGAARGWLDRELGTRVGKATVIALLVGYSWWVATLPPFTWSTRAAVGIPGLLLVAVAIATDRHRQPTGAWWSNAWHQLVRFRAARPLGLGETRVTLAARLAWAGVIAATLALELFVYSHTPRSQYPTLSSLVNIVDGGHLVRTVLILLWFALGWDLLHR